MKATESKYVFIKKKKQYVDSIGYIFSWWPFETPTSQKIAIDIESLPEKLKIP